MQNLYNRKLSPKNVFFCLNDACADVRNIVNFLLSYFMLLLWISWLKWNFSDLLFYYILDKIISWIWFLEVPFYGFLCNVLESLVNCFNCAQDHFYNWKLQVKRIGYFSKRIFNEKEHWKTTPFLSHSQWTGFFFFCKMYFFLVDQ